MAFPALAAAIGAYTVNNAMSEMHAGKQAEREMEMMRAQDSMNRANVLSAYSQRVQGMKMAGLNPALAAEGTPAVASVSKGSAASGENVEFNPADLLLEKQMENLDAQTEKTLAEANKIKGVDTENIKADTDLKTAQKLFTGANQSKVEAETTNLGNVNKVFQEENSAMALFGQTTAQGWQKESWYSKLPKGAKMVIDDIAKGDFDLTVGFTNALNRMIDTDSSMNALEKDKVSYALARSVIEGQMKSPKVMEALVKTPEAQYNEVINRASKLAVETQALRFDLSWSKDKKNVWEKNDPDKLYAEYQKNPTVENAAKWLVSSMRSTGAEVVKGSAPAAIHGSAMRKGMEKAAEKSKPPVWTPTSKGRTMDPGDLQYKDNSYKGTFGNPNWQPPTEPDMGVQSVKFNKRKW